MPLTQGYITVVDNEDYDYLIRFNWCYSDGYAKRRVHGVNIGMHVFIAARMGVHGVMIDHKNQNPLDNRRENIRSANYQQNAANRKSQTNNTSGFRGVGWNSRHGKWKAYIRNNGTLIHLGFFDSRFEAAKAYNRAAVRLFCSQ